MDQTRELVPRQGILVFTFLYFFVPFVVKKRRYSGSIFYLEKGISPTFLCFFIFFGYFLKIVLSFWCAIFVKLNQPFLKLSYSCGQLVKHSGK